MSDGMWFDEVPVVGEMRGADAARVLRELGEADLALAIERAPSEPDRPRVFGGIFDAFRSTPRAWAHTAHTFGFLPLESAGRGGELQSAGRVVADESLRNARITITLNRLRVAEYPGGGTHNILFDFYAQHQVKEGREDAHFNSVFRVNEGSEAAVVGYPIFIGLGVGTVGVSFKCFTVNVKNDQDEKLLGALESNVFKQGLQLVTVAQPALAPLAELAVGLTKSIASRHRNVPVQNFHMGLDFGGTQMGARLAQGDYIAVQIPTDLRKVWRWSDWAYDHDSGLILSRADQTMIPFNYIVFGVQRYEGA